MISAAYIISQIEETLWNDRYSTFVRGKDVLDYRRYRSPDFEDCFEWSDKEGLTYTLVLENVPVEPSKKIILRVHQEEAAEDFNYRLLNEYPTLEEVLLAYGRLVRQAREAGAEGIVYPNDDIWEKLESQEDQS